MTTILDEANLSVRKENWWTVLQDNEDLFEFLMEYEDSANEITESKAAMRVVFWLDTINDEEN